MLTHDTIDALIASDAWGTRAILNICETLPREQFHQKFDIGLSSLHDTLTHMISAMRRWTDRLAKRTPRPMLHAVPEFPHVGGENSDRTPAELLAMHEDAARDLRATMDAIRRDGRLASTISMDWPGSGAEAGLMKTYTLAVGVIIAHVTTHGYHHRAQCLNMLRRLGAPVPGVTPGYPEPSAVDWQVEVESPPVVKRA